MKKNNFHTHTYRCGHASGSEEGMVEAATVMGLDNLGFSEHIPMPHYRQHLLKSINHIRSVRSALSFVKAFILNGPGMRMPYKTMEEHLQAIDACQLKYQGKVVIYKGFEAEGIKEYFDYYQSLLDNGTVDYLILGHHFHDHCIQDCYYGREKIEKKDLYLYCNEVEQAIETELFSYLAHPDLFLIGYHKFDLDAQTVSRRICEKAKEYNIPLEINAGGMRRGLHDINGEQLYLYPNAHFWDIASEVGNDVIIGLDAHHPTHFDSAMYDRLVDFARLHKLHLIDNFTFKQGKK